ncbi:MAG: 4-hydroxy-tetrahydrodipicolinate reductase [Firmicutes bacterium]|nr:4-hydroxy-tetrahydrodipicolinate reductase [Bacillota bacterium]
MADKIRVLVVGACGKMGSEVVRAIDGEPDLELVGAVDHSHTGEDIGSIALGRTNGVLVDNNLERALAKAEPEVCVDFTRPEGLFSRIQTVLNAGVHPVVGTTGLTQVELADLSELCNRLQKGAIIAPNFAIGALLMMKFAKEAARFFPAVEIIELHHPKKVDAPSGTAIKTAEMILETQTKQQSEATQIESVHGVRGGELGGVRIHSVRLPGFVAHQEVIFGGPGQVLTIRHDSMNRESFMPGVILAIRKVRELTGLVYGLDKLIGHHDDTDSI